MPPNELNQELTSSSSPQPTPQAQGQVLPVEDAGKVALGLTEAGPQGQLQAREELQAEVRHHHQVVVERYEAKERLENGVIFDPNQNGSRSLTSSAPVSGAASILAGAKVGAVVGDVDLARRNQDLNESAQGGPAGQKKKGKRSYSIPESVVQVLQNIVPDEQIDKLAKLIEGSDKLQADSPAMSAQIKQIANALKSQNLTGTFIVQSEARGCFADAIGQALAGKLDPSNQGKVAHATEIVVNAAVEELKNGLKLSAQQLGARRGELLAENAAQSTFDEVQKKIELFQSQLEQLKGIALYPELKEQMQKAEAEARGRGVAKKLEQLSQQALFGQSSGNGSLLSNAQALNDYRATQAQFLETNPQIARQVNLREQLAFEHSQTQLIEARKSAEAIYKCLTDFYFANDPTNETTSTASPDLEVLRDFGKQTPQQQRLIREAYNKMCPGEDLVKSLLVADDHKILGDQSARSLIHLSSNGGGASVAASETLESPTSAIALPLSSQLSDQDNARLLIAALREPEQSSKTFSTVLSGIASLREDQWARIVQAAEQLGEAKVLDQLRDRTLTEVQEYAAHEGALRGAEVVNQSALSSQVQSYQNFISELSPYLQMHGVSAASLEPVYTAARDQAAAVSSAQSFGNLVQAHEFSIFTEDGKAEEFGQRIQAFKNSHQSELDRAQTRTDPESGQVRRLDLEASARSRAGALIQQAREINNFSTYLSINSNDILAQLATLTPKGRLGLSDLNLAHSEQLEVRELRRLAEAFSLRSTGQTLEARVNEKFSGSENALARAYLEGDRTRIKAAEAVHLMDGFLPVGTPFSRVTDGEKIEKLRQICQEFAAPKITLEAPSAQASVQEKAIYEAKQKFIAEQREKHQAFEQYYQEYRVNLRSAPESFDALLERKIDQKSAPELQARFQGNILEAEKLQAVALLKDHKTEQFIEKMEAMKRPVLDAQGQVVGVEPHLELIDQVKAACWQKVGRAGSLRELWDNSSFSKTEQKALRYVMQSPEKDAKTEAAGQLPQSAQELEREATIKAYKLAMMLERGAKIEEIEKLYGFEDKRLEYSFKALSFAHRAGRTLSAAEAKAYELLTFKYKADTNFFHNKFEEITGRKAEVALQKNYGDDKRYSSFCDLVNDGERKLEDRIAEATLLRYGTDETAAQSAVSELVQLPEAEQKRVKEAFKSKYIDDMGFFARVWNDIPPAEAVLKAVRIRLDKGPETPGIRAGFGSAFKVSFNLGEALDHYKQGLTYQNVTGGDCMRAILHRELGGDQRFDSLYLYDHGVPSAENRVAHKVQYLKERSQYESDNVFTDLMDVAAKSLKATPLSQTFRDQFSAVTSLAEKSKTGPLSATELAQLNQKLMLCDTELGIYRKVKNHTVDTAANYTYQTIIWGGAIVTIPLSGGTSVGLATGLTATAVAGNAAKIGIKSIKGNSYGDQVLEDVGWAGVDVVTARFTPWAGEKIAQGVRTAAGAAITKGLGVEIQTLERALAGELPGVALENVPPKIGALYGSALRNAAYDRVGAVVQNGQLGMLLADHWGLASGGSLARAAQVVLEPSINVAARSGNHVVTGMGYGVADGLVRGSGRTALNEDTWQQGLGYGAGRTVAGGLDGATHGAVYGGAGGLLFGTGVDLFRGMRYGFQGARAPSDLVQYQREMRAIEKELSAIESAQAGGRKPWTLRSYTTDELGDLALRKDQLLKLVEQRSNQQVDALANQLEVGINPSLELPLTARMRGQMQNALFDVDARAAAAADARAATPLGRTAQTESLNGIRQQIELQEEKVRDLVTEIDIYRSDYLQKARAENIFDRGAELQRIENELAQLRQKEIEQLQAMRRTGVNPDTGRRLTGTEQQQLGEQVEELSSQLKLYNRWRQNNHSGGDLPLNTKHAEIREQALQLQTELAELAKRQAELQRSLRAKTASGERELEALGVERMNLQNQLQAKFKEEADYIGSQIGFGNKVRKINPDTGFKYTPAQNSRMLRTDGAGSWQLSLENRELFNTYRHLTAGVSTPVTEAVARSSSNLISLDGRLDQLQNAAQDFFQSGPFSRYTPAQRAAMAEERLVIHDAIAVARQQRVQMFEDYLKSGVNPDTGLAWSATQRQVIAENLEQARNSFRSFEKFDAEYRASLRRVEQARNAVSTAENPIDSWLTPFINQYSRAISSVQLAFALYGGSAPGLQAGARSIEYGTGPGSRSSMVQNVENSRTAPEKFYQHQEGTGANSGGVAKQQKASTASNQKGVVQVAEEQAPSRVNSTAGATAAKSAEGSSGVSGRVLPGGKILRTTDAGAARSNVQLVEENAARSTTTSSATRSTTSAKVAENPGTQSIVSATQMVENQAVVASTAQAEQQQQQRAEAKRTESEPSNTRKEVEKARQPRQHSHASVRLGFGQHKEPEAREVLHKKKNWLEEEVTKPEGGNVEVAEARRRRGRKEEFDLTEEVWDGSDVKVEKHRQTIIGEG